VLDPPLGWADRLFLTVVRQSNPWIVRAVLGAGWDWMVLLGLTALGVLIVAAFRPLRPLYARMGDDWTLLSFGLYGATVMAVLYTFDDLPVARYPNWGHVGTSASLIILAAGAWVYIRSGQPSREATAGRRALALFGAMALAMIAGAMGKAVIYASPNWLYTSQSAALRAGLVWGWVMVVVLAPALLMLLPRRTRSAQAG
jgi:hypothetical protein